MTECQELLVATVAFLGINTVLLLGTLAIREWQNSKTIERLQRRIKPFEDASAPD